MLNRVDDAAIFRVYGKVDMVARSKGSWLREFTVDRLHVLDDQDFSILPAHDSDNEPLASAPLGLSEACSKTSVRACELAFRSFLTVIVPTL